ncbi:hypothetical protein SAMN05216486_10391 [bacterium JGI 053]|nr:hypothetical protein SAMN05216486_10391 [bacterium JGI 053]
MKKLRLDEFEIESFVTAPDSDSQLGTVHGQADEFNLTENATCNFTCAQSCSFTCYATCRLTCQT